jgi:hypothetical protein
MVGNSDAHHQRIIGPPEDLIGKFLLFFKSSPVDLGLSQKFA